MGHVLTYSYTYCMLFFMSGTLAAMFALTSLSFGLPEGLLSSICYVESKHSAEALNAYDRGGASIGICQVQLATARWLGFKGSQRDLQTNPASNIRLAGMYLSRMIHRYRGDYFKAICAYNAGHYRARPDGTPVNKNYAVKVLREWKSRR